MSLHQKNILFLNNQGLDEAGGGVTILKALIDHLSASNHLTLLSEGPEETTFVEGNLTHIKIRVEAYHKKPFLWRFAPALRSLFVKKRLKNSLSGYDIIIVLDCKYFPAVQAASPNTCNVYLSLSAIPLVGFHDMNECGWFQRSLIFLQYALIERYAFHHSKLSVVASKTHLAEVKKYEWIRTTPEIVYPFIRKHAAFQAKDAALAAQLKREYGCEGKCVVLTMNRITKLKNIEYLIDLAAQMKQENIVFLIAGDGGHRKFLETLAAEKGVQGNLRFLGHQDQPERFYQLADIYIHPSLYESFSCAIYEAMLSGLPVIFPKNIPPYVTAFEEFVESNDAYPLDFTKTALVKDTILRLANDEVLRKQIGENARKKALSFENDQISYAQRIEQIIQQSGGIL